MPAAVCRTTRRDEPTSIAEEGRWCTEDVLRCEGKGKHLHSHQTFEPQDVEDMHPTLHCLLSSLTALQALHRRSISPPPSHKSHYYTIHPIPTRTCLHLLQQRPPSTTGQRKQPTAALARVGGDPPAADPRPVTPAMPGRHPSSHPTDPHFAKLIILCIALGEFSAPCRLCTRSAAGQGRSTPTTTITTRRGRAKYCTWQTGPAYCDQKRKGRRRAPRRRSPSVLCPVRPVSAPTPSRRLAVPNSQASNTSVMGHGFRCSMDGQHQLKKHPTSHSVTLRPGCPSRSHTHLQKSTPVSPCQR